MVYRIEEWAREKEFALPGAPVILQGFGNVGSAAAEILSALGARIVAVNAAYGTVHRDPFCVGKAVDVRTAALGLALKRIGAHDLLEGFSQ